MNFIKRLKKIMSIKKFYKTYVTITRLSDVAGSKREEYQSLSSFACHIQRASAEDAMLGQSGGFFTSFVMYCRASEDIQTQDRVNDGTNDYTVQGVQDRSFGRGNSNRHKRVLLVKGK